MSPDGVVLAPREAGEDSIDLAIGGMTCATCAGRVERALAGVPGVAVAEVNLATEQARITGADLAPAALIAAVEEVGYAALPIGGAAEEARAAREETRRRRALDVSLVAAIVLSVPLLLPMVGVPLSGWFALLLATPVQIVIGARFYRAAWRALRAGSGNMDVLVVLGTTAAYGVSAVAVLRGAGPRYFEAGAMVITLVLLGKWLEGRARRAAGSEIRALMALRPETARVEENGAIVIRPAATVRRGDIVEIRPGERAPVDGRVISGESSIDESLLTGESRPVVKAPGALVMAGTINGEGLLRVSAQAVGAASRLGGIISLVSQALSSKAPVQRLVDRVAAVFVPVVVAAALLTFALWWGVAHDPARGWLAAIAVLVIACPCALGLATPAALIAGIGAAARAGILIRDAETLETAHRIDTVALDKTGTLTAGRPVVSALRGFATAEEDVLRLAAALQQASVHPLAHAVLARAEGLDLDPVTAFESRPGRGLVGRVGGRLLALGNARLLGAYGLAPAPEATALEDAGETVMQLAALEPTPRLLGLIAARDALRPEAPEAVAALRRLGLHVALLSGDNPASVQAVAAALGITEVAGGMTPEDKAAKVAAWQREGRSVAMVGDGVNDAPALAIADLGIAIGGGDAAVAAAGITLMRPDPLLVAAAIAIARRARRKIRQNLFWAFFYNLFGLPLAGLGLLNPMLAGAAMALSSVSVVSNALLLRGWRPPGARQDAESFREVA